MLRPLPRVPGLPKTGASKTIDALDRFDADLLRSLHTEFSQHALAINSLIPEDSIADTPQFAGQLAVVAGVPYIATGTASSADWAEITVV